MPVQPEIILLVSSNIDLPGVSSELQGIRDTLQTAKNKGFIDLQEHGAATYASMQNALTGAGYAGRITMLHYSGHSFEEGIVVEIDGEKRVVGALELKALIQAHHLFRFVFLNSCYSEDIAKAFIDAGVSLVIGTTSLIKDKDAAVVAAKFYELLSSTAINIQEAYALTNAYFVAHPEALQAGGVFRSFDTQLPHENGSNVWKLFMSDEIEGLLEKEKNGATLNRDEALRLEQTARWTLVPQYRTALSDIRNKDYQLKVLCLYTRAGEMYYKGFRNKFSTPNRQVVLIHGVGDIFGAHDFDYQVFEKELEAADAIVHFIEGNNYLDSPFFKLSAQKLDAWNKHAYVPINPIDKEHFEKNTAWFAKSTLLKPETDMQGDYISEIYPGIKKVSIPEVQIENAFLYFKPSWNQFAGALDSDELAEHMKGMPFTVENYRAMTVNNAPVKLLYHILLEGTAACAQQLLIKNIRAMKGIDKNIKSIRLSFEALKVLGGMSLWEAFAKSNDLLIGDESEIPEECAKVLIKKLKNEHVVLVFELFRDVHADTYMQEIETRFWEEFMKQFAKYSKNNSFTNTFLCFVVNYNFEKKPLLISEKYGEFCYVKISPVTRLAETEWNTWYKEDPIYRKLLLYQQLCQPDVFRKKALIEICRSLKVPLNYVDNKVLIYD